MIAISGYSSIGWDDDSSATVTYTTGTTHATGDGVIPSGSMFTLNGSSYQNVHIRPLSWHGRFRIKLCCAWRDFCDFCNQPIDDFLNRRYSRTVYLFRRYILKDPKLIPIIKTSRGTELVR